MKEEQIRQLEKTKASFNRQLRVAQMLLDFEQTRSITTATEICDLMLQEINENEQPRGFNYRRRNTRDVVGSWRGRYERNDRGERMKLRNKKTGLVGELYYEPDKEYH